MIEAKLLTSGTGRTLTITSVTTPKFPSWPKISQLKSGPAETLGQCSDFLYVPFEVTNVQL